MTPSLEGWPTKAIETPPHKVRLTPLDTNPVFQCLGETYLLELSILQNFKIFKADQKSSKQIQGYEDMSFWGQKLSNFPESVFFQK